MTKKRIVVAVVTYNSRAHIGSCLATLNDLSQEDQVVVVDNHSTDGTATFVKEEFPNVILIENERNYFLSYALNQIISAFPAKTYLILNPDVVIQPGTIEQMYQVLIGSQCVGIVAPALISPDGLLQSNARRFPTVRSLFSRFFRLHVGGSVTEAEQAYLLENRLSVNRMNVDWVIGACMLVKRDVFDRVGMYRPIRYPLYYNDADLCWRAFLGGFLIQYVRNLRVIHEYQQRSVYGGVFTLAKLMHITGALLFLSRRFL